MGLFDKLFGRKRQAEEEPEGVVAVAVPDGDASVKVYTYDGRPMGKVRAGTEVRLALYGGGRYRMTSVYTGTTMDDDAILAYEGKAIGFLASGANARALRAALRKHGTLVLHSTVTGWASGGWPEIAIHFDREWLKNYSEE